MFKFWKFFNSIGIIKFNLCVMISRVKLRELA